MTIDQRDRAHLGRAGRRGRRHPLPVARRRRPAERRQVDAGQPHPRPPRGGRRGRARRDPGPGRLRRRLERAAVHRGRHRRLGARRQGLPRQVAAQAELAVAAADAVLFVVDATVGTTDIDEAVVRVLRAAEQAGRPGREQGRRPAHRGRGGRAVEPRSGRAVRRLRPARPGERRPARRDPGGAARGAARGRRTRSRGPRRVALRRQAERRQVEPAEQAGPAAARRSSTTSPAPPSTRSTSWSSSTATIWRFIDTAGIRTRVKEASGTSTTRRCAPRRAIERAEVGRRAARRERAADRAGPADPLPRSRRPAGRWSSRSTSGT